MDEIPDNVVEKIFKFLSKVDRLSSVSYVNKRFKRIAARFYDNFFSLSEFEIPEGNCLEIGEKVHHLLEILFKKRGIGWELKKIDLSFPKKNRNGRIFNKSFALIQNRVHKLEFIQIRNAEISPAAFGILASVRTGLKGIEFSDLRFIQTTENFASGNFASGNSELFNFAPGNPELFNFAPGNFELQNSAVDFQQIFRLNEKTLKKFISKIPIENFFIPSRMNFLEELTLSFWNWNENSVAAIAGQCPNLRNFTLESKSNSAFFLRIDHFSNLQKLQFLTLKFNRCIAIDGFAVDLQEIAFNCQELRGIEIQGVLVISGEIDRIPVQMIGLISHLQEISIEFESKNDVQLFVECIPGFDWHHIRKLGFRLGEIDPMLDLRYY